MVKNTEKEIQILKYPTYALLIVLGIIGFMNLANTLITSIITRKRELGILQAIGLTNKQLSRMLGLEGFVSIAGTLAVSLTLGNLLGYLAFLKLKETGMFGLNVYHFPFMELLIMALSLVLLQLILSLSLIHIFREGDFLWNIIDRDETEMKSLEKISIKDLIHRDFNPPVHISSSMKELLERAKNQNFVPVVDDRGFFVGIITRKDIITYFCDNYLEDSEQDK